MDFYEISIEISIQLVILRGIDKVGSGHFAINVRMLWLLGWRHISSLHSADESHEGRNSCPLLSVLVMLVSRNFFHVVSALQFIVCLNIFFLADQISCWSYVDSVR